MCPPCGSYAVAAGNIAFILISVLIFALDIESDDPWILFAVFNVLLNAASAVLLVMLLCKDKSLMLRLANAIYTAVMALHSLNVGFAVYLLNEGLSSLSCSDAEGKAYDDCITDKRGTGFALGAIAAIISLCIRAVIFWQYLKYYRALRKELTTTLRE